MITVSLKKESKNTYTHVQEFNEIYKYLCIRDVNYKEEVLRLTTQLNHLFIQSTMNSIYCR